MVELFLVVLEKCSTILTENAIDTGLIIVMLDIRMIILDEKGTPDNMGRLNDIRPIATPPITFVL